MSYRAATWRLSHSAQRRGIQRTPGCNAGRCSFFSAARRTNQEAPPLLSGFVARRLAPPSGAAELAALRHSSPSCLGRLASSRPDKGGGGTLRRIVPVIPRLTRNSEIPSVIPGLTWNLGNSRAVFYLVSFSVYTFYRATGTPHRGAR